MRVLAIVTTKKAEKSEIRRRGESECARWKCIESARKVVKGESARKRRKVTKQ